MWTAKITAKNRDTKQVTVQFTDGTKTDEITITPQDRLGFDHWVQSELKTRNSLDELVEEDNIDQVISPKVDEELTQDEKDRRLWLQREALKDQIDVAIEKGYLTGTETKVVQLNTWLKANFKPEYIGLL